MPIDDMEKSAVWRGWLIGLWSRCLVAVLAVGVARAQQPSSECCSPVSVNDLYALSLLLGGDEVHEPVTPAAPMDLSLVGDATFARDPLTALNPLRSSTAGADSVMLRDVGMGQTSVSTYGSVVRRLPMPVMEDGMSGLARLYHQTLVFDVSAPAWLGTGTQLKPAMPVPDMSAAALDIDTAVQPRPGNMPGLYLLQVDHAAGPAFYQYGGPLETGANPQVTAVFSNGNLAQSQGGSSKGSPSRVARAVVPKRSVPAMQYRFTSNLSGAQLWQDVAAGVVEIRHIDGTVASYKAFQPFRTSYQPSPPRTMWRLESVRDPYDNISSFVWNGQHQLVEIRFPSGLTQVFDWSPTWGWSGKDCLEVRYEQGGASPPEAAARTWGIVFQGATSVSGGRYFGRRLHRVYSASRKVLVDSSGQGAIVIDATAEVDAQIVHEFTYDPAGATTPATLSEWHKVHSGVPFAQTLVTDSHTSRKILETTYSVDGRFASQERTMTSEKLVASYPAPTRTSEVLSGTAMRSIEVTKVGGSTYRFDYDKWSGRLYSEFVTPSSDASGRPRATEFPSGAGHSAAGVEPDEMERYFVYADASCGCRKPIRLEIRSTRSGQTVKRTHEYEYFSGTKLLKAHRAPNPAHGSSGSQPPHVEWSYTYIQFKGAGHMWGAWLPQTEVTPDGTYVYTHSEPLDRLDAVQHGQIPGKTVRAISGVRIQDTLGGAANLTVAGSTVSETVWRNLANAPGGLAQQGSVHGQVRKSSDGDGVETVYSYDASGRLTRVLARSTERTDFVLSAIGDVEQVTHNASSGQPAVVSYELAGSSPAVRKVASASSGVSREARAYYDRFGHRTVVRRNNLGSNGSKPTRHGAGVASARDWIESQYHYHHTQLMEVYRDRKPLDEPGGGQQHLVASFGYGADGRLLSVTRGNGSVTTVVQDGYGSVFRSVTQDPQGSEQLSSPSNFVNEFLEVTAAYQQASNHDGSGTDDLWTVIERNAAGAITSVTEPATSAPIGYTHSTGGARHDFEIDTMGRITMTETTGAGQVLARSRRRYDQLSRVIWSQDDVLRRDVAGSSPMAVQQTAWQFVPGRESHVGRMLRSGLDPTTYEYLASSGRLHRATQSGDVVEYGYHSGSPYVANIVRRDVDAGFGGLRTVECEFDVDAFGKVTRVRRGANTPSPLVYSYGYDSLGEPDRYTDPKGLVHKYLRDALGRLVEHARVAPGGTFILNSALFTDVGAPQGDGRMIRQDLDGNGNVTSTHYDFAGRPFVLQRPGATTLPSASAPNQELCLFAVYDSASRMTDIYDGDQGRTRFARDGKGRVIKRWLDGAPTKISGWNVTDWIRRDALGRVEVQDYLADPVNQVPIGTVARREDSIGRVHRESYAFAAATANVLEVESVFAGDDPFRSQMSFLDGLGGSSSFEQKLGVAFVRDGRGRLDLLSWDTSGDLSGPTKPLASYGWTGTLRRTRSLTPEGGNAPVFGTTRSWDLLGRPIRIEHTFSDLQAPNAVVFSDFDFEYDAVNNLEKEVHTKVDGSAGDRFAYDDFHRLEKAWLGVATMSGAPPAGYVAGQVGEFEQVGMDAVHNRTFVHRQGAATGGLLQQVYQTQDGAHPQGASNRYATVSAPGVGGAGAAVPYEYDGRGNLICDGVHVFKYDYMNRLSEIWEILPDAPVGEDDKYAEVQEDAFKSAQDDVRQGVTNLYGRLLKEHMSPAFQDQLKASVVGGVITLNPAGGGGKPGFLPTPGQLQLKAVFVYDAYNRRSVSVWVGVGTFFHVHDGWAEVAECGLEDTAPNTVVPKKEFVWGASSTELVAYRQKDASGTWRSYHVLQGLRDSSSVLVDESGAVVESYEYGPHGKPAVFVAGGNAQDHSSVGQPFLWNGLRWDSASALVYARNRYYSPAIGRFLTRDPIGAFSDSYNLGNAYAFGGSRPLTHTDPSGLITVVLVIGDDSNGADGRPVEAFHASIDGTEDIDGVVVIHARRDEDGEIVVSTRFEPPSKYGAWFAKGKGWVEKKDRKGLVKPGLQGGLKMHICGHGNPDGTFPDMEAAEAGLKEVGAWLSLADRWHGLKPDISIFSCYAGKIPGGPKSANNLVLTMLKRFPFRSLKADRKSPLLKTQPDARSFDINTDYLWKDLLEIK